MHIMFGSFAFVSLWLPLVFLLSCLHGHVCASAFASVCLRACVCVCMNVYVGHD